MSDRFLRRAEVQSRVGLSRSSVYRLCLRGEFPPPVRISPRAIAWLESEVSAWIETRLLTGRKARLPSGAVGPLELPPADRGATREILGRGVPSRRRRTTPRSRIKHP